MQEDEAIVIQEELQLREALRSSTLLKELREEARRKGLPALEDATYVQLEQLIHVLPADLHTWAGQEAEELGEITGMKPDVTGLLVETIRYYVLAAQQEPRN